MKTTLSKVFSSFFLFAFLLGTAETSFAFSKNYQLFLSRQRPSIATPAQDAAKSFAPAKKYIVVLNDALSGAEIVASDVQNSFAVQPKLVYSRALRGFSADLTGVELARLKADPRVKFVSEDGVVSITSHRFPAYLHPASFLAVPPTEKKPTGISRIGAPLSYLRGTGIGVAVIDTGIDLDHPDLKENIVANTSCIAGVPTGDDDHGHGSHVAGTIAARANDIGVVGVVPEAKLIAVKVLNSWGSGQWSEVICGVDWVTAHAEQYNIKVANMSLGGWGSSDNNCGNTNGDALHHAICNSAAAGVTYVVAAGNSGRDAAGFVPAAYDDTLITVSALADSDGAAGGFGPATSRGPDDTFATFSNYGPAVDIGAPGVDILSAYKNGLYTKMSGTSMASPHVAGAAAAYIQAYGWTLSWQEVRDGLRAIGEPLGAGHTDPSGKHSEPIVQLTL